MAQQYRSEALEEKLRTLHTVVEGVKATVIVNIDGLLVASYPAGDEENPHENPTSIPQVAAMSATLIGLAERTLKRLAQGELERLLMEGEEGVIAVPASRGGAGRSGTGEADRAEGASIHGEHLDAGDDVVQRVHVEATARGGDVLDGVRPGGDDLLPGLALRMSGIWARE